MSIQKTPPLGWPHTDAAKYGNLETEHIPTAALPPEEKKQSGCCGGMLGAILVLVIFLVVIAAVVTDCAEDEYTEESSQSAEDAFVAANPGWEIESAELLDENGIVRLVVWEYDLGIGRITLMDPDPYLEGGWVEQEILPAGTEWSEDHFYQAFADAYSVLHWSYAVDVQSSTESTSSEDHVVSYRVWDDDTAQWSDVHTATAVLRPSEGWLIQGSDASSEPTTSGDTL